MQHKYLKPELIASHYPLMSVLWLKVEKSTKSQSAFNVKETFSDTLTLDLVHDINFEFFNLTWNIDKVVLRFQQTIFARPIRTLVFFHFKRHSTSRKTVPIRRQMNLLPWPVNIWRKEDTKFHRNWLLSHQRQLETKLKAQSGILLMEGAKAILTGIYGHRRIWQMEHRGRSFRIKNQCSV